MALNQTLARNIENLARRLVNATSGANGRPNFIRLKTEVNKLVTAAKGVAKLNIPRPAPNVRRQVQRPSNFALYQERRNKTDAAYMTAYAASPEGKAAAAQEATRAAANRAKRTIMNKKLKELDAALNALIEKVKTGLDYSNLQTMRSIPSQISQINNARARNNRTLVLSMLRKVEENGKKGDQVYDIVKRIAEKVVQLRTNSAREEYQAERALKNINKNGQFSNQINKWKTGISHRRVMAGLSNWERYH